MACSIIRARLTGVPSMDASIRLKLTNSIMTDFTDNLIQQFKANLIMKLNVLLMIDKFPYADLGNRFFKVIFKKSQRLSDL